MVNATGYTATATPSGGTAVTGSVTGTEAAFTGLTANTTYTVSITAIGNANYNNSRAETLSVTTLADTAPTFAPGTTIPAQIWTVDTPVNLTLPGATGGDGTLSYTLTPALPTGVTLNASTRVVSGTPTSATSTTAYTWRTTDSDSDTAALFFSVTVDRATLPSPMNLAVKPDTQTQNGFTVTWNAVANATGYTATATPSGGTAVTGSVTGTEAAFTGLTANTTYTVSITAIGNANYNNSRAETLSVTTLADTAPTFAPGTTIPAQIWTVGTPVNLALPEATGGDGTLSYTLTPALPAGVTLNASTRVVSGTPTSATSTTAYTWRTTDSDSNTANSDTAALTFNVTVGRATLPSPMNLAVKPDTQTETGFTVTWEAVANATGYTATAAPSGGTAVTGSVTGTEAAFTGLTANTTYTVSITATGNANYNNSRAETLSVTTLADTAPAFAQGTTIPAQIWTVGTPVNLTLPEATGGDGTLSYTLTPALPAGVTLDVATRVVSGTPTSATSTATYTWRTSDSDSNTANSDTAALFFSVTVDRATLPSPMNLAVKPDTQTRNGFTVMWEAVVNATGYTATATPSGGTAVTGSVTGTEAAFTGLTANTTYTVSITATGNANYNNSQAETLSVTTLADTAPAFAQGTVIPAQIWTVDTPVNLALPEATGGDGTLSYTLTPALPAGVTLNASTRVVSGTPTSATSTTAYTWRTTDSDSNTANSDTAALTFSVTVDRATLPPPMNLAVKPDTQTETGFTVMWEAVANATGYTATATPSGGEPVTGAVDTTGSTPEASFTGLSMNTTYTVSITATGNANYNNSRAETLSVTTLADTAPTFAPGTTIPAQIWTVDTPVNLTLPEATGGNGTISYTLTPALPAGVTLNVATRVVSGTPTSATSTTAYTWRTTDSDSNTANSDTAALTFQCDGGQGDSAPTNEFSAAAGHADRDRLHGELGSGAECGGVRGDGDTYIK